MLDKCAVERIEAILSCGNDAEVRKIKNPLTRIESVRVYEIVKRKKYEGTLNEVD